MGNCCLPIQFRRASSAAHPKNITLLLLGLDNSGKTTIAKRLAGEPVDSVVPTVGFSVILLRRKGCHVSIYDLGGGPQIRDIWPRYYADAHGVIFVTDATDLQKLNECRQVLQDLLRNEQVSGKPILLLANKQDLEGALDEIDVVERLNLEQLVNEQKCPTLVELCSALNFSKKIDIGIDNGYKWLIRSIVRDYPNLNNRVLSDLAKQEEENKVHVIKRSKRVEDFIERDDSKIPKEHLNGINVPRRKILTGVKTTTWIPGQVEEVPENWENGKTQTEGKIKPFSGANCASYSSEFFTFERFQSDMELLNDVTNQTFKSFLIRPKSSGARLYGVSSERRRSHGRKPLKKYNKTGPSPFTDISNDQDKGRKFEETNARKLQEKTSIENVNPFLAITGTEEKWKETYEMKALGETKSMPNSRSSTGLSDRRRHSLVNGKLQTNRFSEVNEEPASTGMILDVTKLAD